MAFAAYSDESIEAEGLGSIQNLLFHMSGQPGQTHHKDRWRWDSAPQSYIDVNKSIKNPVSATLARGVSSASYLRSTKFSRHDRPTRVTVKGFSGTLIWSGCKK